MHALRVLRAVASVAIIRRGAARASNKPRYMIRPSASRAGDRRVARAPCHRPGPPGEVLTGVTAFAFAVAVARDLSNDCVSNVTIQFRTAEGTYAAFMAPDYRCVLADFDRTAEQLFEKLGSDADLESAW